MLQRVGADTVVCTDGDERAVENLRTNFRISQLRPLTTASHARVATLCAHMQRHSGAFATLTGADFFFFLSSFFFFSPADNVDLADVRDPSAALLPSGVHVDTLMWDSPSREELVRQASADVILSCDTIYLPEVHDALASLVRLCLQLPYPSSPADGQGQGQGDRPARVAYFTQMNRNPETFDSYTTTFARHGLRLEPVDYSSLPLRFAYDRESINFHKITLQ